MRRQELGPLKSLIIKPATLERYRRAADHFFAHLRRQREPIPQTPKIMDIVLSEYIGELWEEGHSKSLAGDTISGLQHHQLSLKGELKTSWRYLKAWQQAEVPARAPPFVITDPCNFLWLGTSTKSSLGFGFTAWFSCAPCGRENCYNYRLRIVLFNKIIYILFLGQTKTSFSKCKCRFCPFSPSSTRIAARCLEEFGAQEWLPSRL